MDSATTPSSPATPTAPTSPASTASTSSSLRSQGSLQPKCAPAKDPPSDGWQKKGTRLATVSTHEKWLYSNQMSSVFQGKKKVKPGGTAKSVGFPCMRGNVTPDIIPSRHIRMPTEGMLKILGFYLPQVKRNVP